MYILGSVGAEINQVLSKHRVYQDKSTFGDVIWIISGCTWITEYMNIKTHMIVEFVVR